MTSQSFYAPFYDQQMIGWVFLIPTEHASKMTPREYKKKDGSVIVGPFSDYITAQARANTTFEALKGVRYATKS